MNPFSEAINSTRSRALEALLDFGFWVRGHLPDDKVPEVADVLTKRFDPKASIPLTLPERALLGAHFARIISLSAKWATDNVANVFPRSDIPQWMEIFGSYIRYSQPYKPAYDVLREEFIFALNNVKEMSSNESFSTNMTDVLAQHLFAYYIWDVFPLKGTNSLLELFYTKTADDPARWAHLFNHVGHALENSGNHLEKRLIERIKSFFDWRLAVQSPQELQEFTFWLSAACLEAEWRLDAYCKVLDITPVNDMGFSIALETLNKLLADHVPKVVECFAKMTKQIDQDQSLYVSTERATPVLKAGLESEDQEVRENAEQARENLLRIGRFDFLDI